MDHKGPEHHYDEAECPECGSFFQQGELQPETVRNNCPECGFDLRSATGGRPYRGQPSPTNSDMTERNTPLDGSSADRGGNPLGEGILAKSVIEEAEEQADQVTDPTDPEGLGELHPVKDNTWKPGDKTDRGMGRDEMLASVKKLGFEDEQSLWDEVVSEFESAHQKPDNSNKIAAAPWLENDGADSNIPVDHLGWDIVDVVEPSKELTEAQNKYTMPLPNGITDELHEALTKLNAWVENPEENGKLRPYKEYWSVIRPNISQGSIQIGVEDPRMADIINHIARTDDLSALDKTSSMQKVALPALEFLAPVAEALGIGGAEAAGAGAAGAEAAGAAEAGGSAVSKIAPWMKGALGKGSDYGKKYLQYQGINSIMDPETDPNNLGGELSAGSDIGAAYNQAVDSLTPDVPVGSPGSYTPLDLAPVSSVRTATYGDEYEHPSSITRRIEDPVNGGIDPHQRTDESNDDWGYDMLDVNEMGQSKDIRGTDDVQEKHKRLVSSSDEQGIIDNFLELFPLVFEFAFSEESGMDDPIIKSLHESIESVFPNYLDSAPGDFPVIGEDKPENEKKSASSPGFDLGSGFDGQVNPVTPDPTMGNEQKKPNVVDPSTHGFDPQAGPAGAAGDTPGWDTQTAPNLVNNTQPLTPQEQQQATQMTQKQKQQQQVNQQQIMQQQKQHPAPQRLASHTQGPHTDEQQAAVAELLIAEGREDEVPNMLERPDEYSDELAAIQEKQPLADEKSVQAPPAQQMAPTPNQGMPPGVPPMQAPSPADLGGGAPGGMNPAPITASMLKAAYKYGADSIAGKCPKCDSHTTKMVQQDGSCKCHTCGHEWNDGTFEAADGHSSDMSSTAAFYANMDVDYDELMDLDTLDEFHDGPTGNSIEPSRMLPAFYQEPAEEPYSIKEPSEASNWMQQLEEKFPQIKNMSEAEKMEFFTKNFKNVSVKNLLNKGAALDSFAEEPELEPEVDESSHVWKDESGEPLQEGKSYEIFAHNYDIPDVGQVKQVKPDAIVYEIESDGGLRTTIEIDRKEANLNQYRFVSTDGPEDNHPGIEENMDSKPVPVPGETTDLSTPHIQIGSSFKQADINEFFLDGTVNPEAEAVIVQAARDWLKELDGPDLFTDFADVSYEEYAGIIDSLTDEQVKQAVDRHFEGGWNGLTSQMFSTMDNSERFAKTAGKHYTPMEQRELIDEYGEARNSDKLNLEGTHYAEADDDYFLFGC
jgi:hypothetical protein